MLTPPTLLAIDVSAVNMICGREKPMTRKKAYHHGNLRQALIDAAFELIEERGVPALTLREVAQSCRVNVAALARALLR